MICKFHTTIFFFFKQKTAYELRISDWSSDVCSSDLVLPALERALRGLRRAVARGNRVDPRRVGGRGRRGGAADQRAAARAPGPAPAGEYDHAHRLVARARALGRPGRARLPALRPVRRGAPLPDPLSPAAGPDRRDRAVAGS